MVWFSDFKDFFHNLSKDPRVAGAQKESDIRAEKAAARASASSGRNQPTPPQPEPVKDGFSTGHPGSQLRQVVK